MLHYCLGVKKSIEPFKDSQNFLPVKAVSIYGSDSTRSGTGTVLDRNKVISVQPQNILCSGVGPCKAFLLR